MTRLFVRFYLLVFATLIAAWFIQWYLQNQKNETNFQVIQAAFSSPIRMVRNRMNQADDIEGEFESIRPVFDYPITLIPRENIDAELTEEANYYLKDGGLHAITQLEGDRGFVDFGPFPSLVGPTAIQQLTALAILLGLVAIIIAFLLKPVVNQLNLVEKTARLIAGGDFQARIDESKVGSAQSMANSFNTMADKVEKLLSTQRSLLQSVSHELRTPLSRIHFGIELVRNAKSEEERQTRLDKVVDSAEELDSLVDELLRFVRLDQMEPIQSEECDLREICERQIENLQMLFPDVEFCIGDGISNHQVNPNDPAAETCDRVKLFADRVALDRAMGNLISNAARFCKSTVRVNAEVDEGGIRIIVDDDGPGIKEEDRSEIFQPFKTLDSDLARTGLGLAIVKKIVQNHQAEIYVQDNPQNGCRMVIQWPAVSINQSD